MFNSNNIEQVKENINIVNLAIDFGYTPTKSGFIHSIYKKEKTPSLKLYPPDRFKCYATGKHGDSIQFYQDVKGINFVTAIKELSQGSNRLFTNNNCKPYNINNNSQKKKYKLLTSEKEIFEERAGILEYDAFISRDEAERFSWKEIESRRESLCISIYKTLADSSALNIEAYDYLRSSMRKLTDESIKKFRLFTVNNKSLDILLELYSVDELRISGLIDMKGRFIFRNHNLIIPYIENGTIVYLRGRVLINSNSKASKKVSKYCSLINNLGNLRGKRFFNFETLSNHEDNRLIITEGEFDCMIAEQVGHKAIGIPGVASFPFEMVQLLAGNKIYIAFDNDPAGAKAATEVIKLLINSPFIDKPIYRMNIKNVKDITEVICRIY